MWNCMNPIRYCLYTYTYMFMEYIHDRPPARDVSPFLVFRFQGRIYTRVSRRFRGRSYVDAKPFHAKLLHTHILYSLMCCRSLSLSPFSSADHNLFLLCLWLSPSLSLLGAEKLLRFWIRGYDVAKPWRWFSQVHICSLREGKLLRRFKRQRKYECARKVTPMRLYLSARMLSPFVRCIENITFPAIIIPSNNLH